MIENKYIMFLVLNHPISFYVFFNFWYRYSAKSGSPPFLLIISSSILLPSSKLTHIVLFFASPLTFFQSIFSLLQHFPSLHTFLLKYRPLLSINPAFTAILSSATFSSQLPFHPLPLTVCSYAPVIHSSVIHYIVSASGFFAHTQAVSWRLVQLGTCDYILKS